MRISVRWLAEYVSVPASTTELADRLTLAGFEVERIERPGDAVRGVIVAQIKESVPHPNAEKLSVTRVDVGTSSLLQVVCGAKNYRVGDKVALAPVGTQLPNGAQIKQANLRGVESFGMLCSGKELGLSEDASGLLILDPSALIGSPLGEALGLDDTLLEIEVTPNRPDALSHIGMAREVSVLTGQQLRLPEPRPMERGAAAAEKIRIRLEDPVRCPRYAARVVEEVAIGPSPSWLAARLRACVVRPINNVVDVTNFVLLEYGQPLHAFDLDKVVGAEIVVRCAKAGEKLTTLDGQERILDRDDLLICDRDKPQAIAGVMGGTIGEVTLSTRRVLLEGANFQPSTIRRTSKRHGLHTEASHRFERGMDVNAIPAALDRAAAMIADLARGTVRRGRVEAYPKPIEARKVSLRYARVGELLGMEVPAQESDRILRALGFARGPGTAQTIYTVPTFRVDVEREEDLIEEVARVRGYDAIPTALPRGVSELSPELPEIEAERRLRLALSGAGFNEVLNYSFVAPQQLSALEAPPGIALKNPLSVEQSVMRTTLYAGLLQNLSNSLRHHAESVSLYELGRVYAPKPAGGEKRAAPAREDLHLAGVLWGARRGRTWTAKDESVDFFDAKGAVECVLSALNIRGASFENAEISSLHPRAAALVRVSGSGEPLGSVGQLHPKVAKSMGAPAATFVFELNAQRLYAMAELVPTYQPLWRYPPVLRDLAVVVPVELQNAEVRKVILEVGRPLVEDAIVFDVYTGKPIPAGRKNLAYAIRYRSPERTLTDPEVNEAHQRIIEEVNRRLGGSLRGASPS
jgi:phenylalanyl-tRNA synthetase beta chain